MANEVFDKCQLRVTRDENQGAYVVSVVLPDGVSFPIGGKKLGKVDQLRAEAASSKSSKSK